MVKFVMYFSDETIRGIADSFRECERIAKNILKSRKDDARCFFFENKVNGTFKEYQSYRTQVLFGGNRILLCPARSYPF